MRVHSAATFALLGLAAAVYAADVTTLSDLPDLSTATDATTKTSATSAAASTTDTSAASDSTASSNTDSSATTSGSATTTTGSSTSNSVFHLTGLPTIAGAGIPTLVIPYTAAAPFMQKSNLPEGTVFICIGAILGFLGACVLAWRGMIAWTINRSVKRAALASIMAGDAKLPSGWTSSSTPKYGKLYNAPAADTSTISLDALTASGKTLGSSNNNFNNNNNTRRTSAQPPSRKDQSRDPSALFFSPTATQPNASSTTTAPQSRNSSYLPAGYYATPSAQAGATLSGRNNTSPPESPARPRQQQRPSSSHLRAPSSSRPRDDSRTRTSWQSTNTGGIINGARNSSLLLNPSSSSLAVGTGHYSSGGASEEDLPGSRAPSRYFDELLDNHGFGPRERF